MRWILGGFFALVGLVMLIFATITAITAADSRDWPSVKGRMLVSEVESRTSGGTGGSRSTRSNSTTYTPRIEYEYTVDGEEYRGKSLELIERGRGKREEIEQVIADFPAGATVSVFYDPEDPETSVLRRGTPSAMGIPFVLGFVAIFVGGAIVLLMQPAEKPYKRGSRK